MDCVLCGSVGGGMDYLLSSLGLCCVSDDARAPSAAAGARPHGSKSSVLQRWAEIGPAKGKIGLGGGDGFCAKCDGRVVGHERYAHGGAVYHKDCVRCSDCGASLASENKHAVAAHTWHCDRCDQKAANGARRSAATHVVGRTASQAGLKHMASTRGDIDLVMTLIGDELEAMLDSKRAAACHICGGDFRAADEATFRVVGDKLVPVAHAECAALGRPRDGVLRPATHPRVAAKRVPETFVLNVRAPESMTFYFTRAAEAVSTLTARQRLSSPAARERDAPVTLYFVPDAASVPHARRLRTPMRPEFEAAEVHVVGDADYGRVAVEAGSKLEGGAQVFLLSALKADRLRYTIKLICRVESLNAPLTPLSLELTIAMP
ncbi:hypothetical protein M885DRAFT_509981 [Pelagophyceae sp. CCMP2097]|nr:hypothetical protein M885DRAFT_509981 [Pelagophyceae sp. CCMP2097]